MFQLLALLMLVLSLASQNGASQWFRSRDNEKSYDLRSQNRVDECNCTDAELMQVSKIPSMFHI